MSDVSSFRIWSTIPCTIRLIFLMFGLLPRRTDFIRSLATTTDWEYVRLARSRAFSVSPDAAAVGGPTVNTWTPASSSRSTRVASRSSGGSALTPCRTDNRIIQSFVVAPSCTSSDPAPLVRKIVRMWLKLA